MSAPEPFFDYVKFKLYSFKADEVTIDNYQTVEFDEESKIVESEFKSISFGQDEVTIILKGEEYKPKKGTKKHVVVPVIEYKYYDEDLVIIPNQPIVMTSKNSIIVGGTFTFKRDKTFDFKMD